MNLITNCYQCDTVAELVKDSRCQTCVTSREISHHHYARWLYVYGGDISYSLTEYIKNSDELDENHDPKECFYCSSVEA